MPLLKFKCETCGRPKERIIEVGQSPGDCAYCGGLLLHAPTGPTCQVIEKIDTGSMGKAVERLADGQRLRDERVAAHKEVVR